MAGDFACNHIHSCIPRSAAGWKDLKAPLRCCAFQSCQSAHHGVSLAFQLAETKAKLDVSERRVGELEEERHRQHPEDGRLRALGRERPLQGAVGGCTLTLAVLGVERCLAFPLS